MSDKPSQTPSIGESELDAPHRPTHETEHLAEQMSVLLAELVRTPEVKLSEGWTLGLAAGQRLGRFVLRRPLGRGGFGVVWEAEDPDLQRPVAVKVVKPGSSLGLARRRVDAARGRGGGPAQPPQHRHASTTSAPARPAPTWSSSCSPAGRSTPGWRSGTSTFGEALHVAIRVARALVHAHARPASSTAISSRATSSSPPAAGSRCSTSAWPTSSAGPGRATGARRPSWRRSSGGASRATPGPTSSPSAPCSTPCSARAPSPTRPGAARAR